MTRRLWIAFVLASLAGAQMKPTRKADEYPAHGSTPQFDLGAEYMFHSIPTERGALFVGDYIVVEVALYPTKGPVVIEYRNFVLRMNGKKVLYSETPGFVGASIKYPDWETPHGVQTEAQVGPVIVGQPPNPGRFPDDPTRSRPLPRRPGDTTTPETQKEGELTVEQYVTRAALPDGETATPVKGCMFFQYNGMLKSIKSLDLVYNDGNGNKVAVRVL